MKVVFTVASYYPQKDGVQYVTQQQAESLAKKGYDVVVITSSMEKELDSLLYNGVRIIRVNAHNKHLFHAGDRQAFVDVLLQEISDADVMINVCLQSYSADWVLPILRSINTKKILYMHGMHSFKWGKSDFKSIRSVFVKALRNLRWGSFYSINWKKIKGYDAVVHLHECDVSYEFFKRHGYSKNRILYNAVEDIFFSYSTKKKMIINVGSFTERKNQIEALKFFYKSNCKDFSLVLIGNPCNEYYKKIQLFKEKCERKYGYRDVKILCNISREETISYFEMSSIYLLTSTWEAFPVSIAEGMAAHIPFISSDVGILSHLPGGIICHNEKEFIMAIELLTNQEECWNLLSEEAFAFAKHYLNISIQGKMLNDIICDVINAEKE